MKKITLLFFVIFCIYPTISLASDHTLISNPDGKIGSFIVTLGGFVGFGDMEEYIRGYDAENYNLSSHSFLCKLDHPISRHVTYSLQIEYQHTKIGRGGIYEGTTSVFYIGSYMKFFSE